MAAAIGRMPVTGDGHANIGDVPIALKDGVRIDVGMHRARYKVTLECDAATLVAHRVGCGDDFTGQWRRRAR